MKAFKVAMLGDSGTGKSCIIGQLAMNKFLGKTNVTVGADSTFQRIELGSGDMIQMNIWDTAGLEQFRSIAPMYIRGAQAIILVFELGKRSSFQEANSWFEFAKEHHEEPHNLKFILVGNKADIGPSDRVISFHEGELFAKDRGFVAYIEASAKENTNIRQIFQVLGEGNNFIILCNSPTHSHSINQSIISKLSFVVQPL
eukprot:m.35578 g.35578  ORF g.35578 m.35578 type:complete len:200 (+) comp6612_c0_seq3:362-961(+)